MSSGTPGARSTEEREITAAEGALSTLDTPRSDVCNELCNDDDADAHASVGVGVLFRREGEAPRGARLYDAAVTEARLEGRRHWRDYRTRAGGRPVKTFLDGLTDEEVAAIVAGMKEVAERGLVAAKHLRGDLYEVRADAATRSFRVVFATEGRYSQVLLSLSAFEKRTQKTPRRELELAQDRLRDWRERGATRKRGARSRA